MGAGASSQAAFEHMLACTMILGEAMVNGLDPRYVRFPGTQCNAMEWRITSLQLVFE
ncbi:hypothetical protein PINS_up023724 [Pythium insidiosum]|nr:hypothetical protein PINS_up023724 [Pythium insidiosum]